MRHRRFTSAMMLVIITLLFSFTTEAFRIERNLPLARARLPSLSSSKPDTISSISEQKGNRALEADIKQSGKGSEDDEEFCLRDKETGEIILLTKEEKERIFLDTVQSYYFSGKTALSDKQFDRLREDLSWDGSALVTLNRNETLFLNAMQAYNKGQPILTDQQFDDLKKALKESNSKLAVATEPKIYLDTGVCKVTWTPDTIRTASLYFPATLLFSTLFLGIFYEIPFIRLYLNPIFLLALGSYPLFKASKKVTEEYLFTNPFVATGPCPKCGVENRVFFGDVFGVKGDMDESTIKCTNCKSSLTIKRNTLRVSTLIAPKAPPPST
mmetsp:Transcript_5758/g.6286  ORF Transcript_5758/g.6286 Transcript_5758/m.6286 type:complete len:327 (+) Transcript_5758:129-1109(+)